MIKEFHVSQISIGNVSVVVLKYIKDIYFMLSEYSISIQVRKTEFDENVLGYLD